VHAWLLTRVDPRAALVAADAALTEAREVAYPIAIAVNQRTQAFARIGLGDLAGAAVTLDGLLDDLVERGALANARVLVDAVAALARTADHPAADTLVATARSLPITTLPSSQFELIPLGDTNAAALPRREVFAAARRVLDELSSTTFADRPERRQGAVRVHGDLCEFEFAGRGVTVRRSKGIADVVRLLTEPGVEVPAVDLAGAGVEQASTGELVDARARREYEDRIRELQADIDAAEADNDYARAYRHQVEFDAIVEHLTAAIGRGGRRRRGADTAERARSAVTHRVRSAIRQLEQVHPALAHHLAHAIQTGTYCSYRPEHPVDWAVDAAVDRAGE